MSDDLLRDAARALASMEPDERSEELTRSRIMASLQGRQRRRRAKLFVWLPLAALLLGGTAWAAATGRFPEVVRAALRAAGANADPSPANAVKRRAAAVALDAKSEVHAPAVATDTEGASRATAPPPLGSDRAEDPTHEVVGSGAPSESAETSVRARPRQTPPAAVAATLGANGATAAGHDASGGSTSASAPIASASSTETASPAAAPPEEEALYRAAHRAHFVEHDPARALSAWNDYIAFAPNGRFALEARYNRALCLVRLGRREEAKQALAPFAEGTYGGYRKREAEELIQALDGAR